MKNNNKNNEDKFLYSQRFLIDKKTKDYIAEFLSNEKEFIKKAHSLPGYPEASAKFGQSKNINRLCEMIKALYENLKANNFSINNDKKTESHDFETIIYEKDAETSKYAILMAIDNLRKIVSGLEKHTNTDIDKIQDFRMYGRSASR